MRHVDEAVSRAEAARSCAGKPREDRLFDEGVLRELVHRQERLARLHARIEAAQGRECERLWQRFFLCYDDFIEALQHRAAGPEPCRPMHVTPGRVRR